MKSAKAAKGYFAKTDYYASCPGDWLGKGAERLGLRGTADPTRFHALADNLDPRTGRTLRPHAREGDRVGCDFTFNSTKSVGIARELAGPGNAGDPRIEDAHREAVSYAVGLIEQDMQARVRVGGADEDRATGNLVAYRVTHRDTRINADDRHPDMSLHDHVFVFNTTFDPVEGKWKACQLGRVKHDAPFYEACYHNRLAANLKALGYGIRREGKAFEVAGIPRATIEKFSRRRSHIKAVADRLGITSPEGRSRLGATTRLGKAKETADDLRAYYAARLAEAEKGSLASLEDRPSHESDERKAVAFALGHTYERRSVAEERKVHEAALRHGIGSVTLEEVVDEARRQGLLVRGGLATTRDVLAEETALIDFAREGRGACAPLRAGWSCDAGEATQGAPAALSAEQQAMVAHVLGSTDRVVLVIGRAGTGKTHAVRAALGEIDRPVELLAPSADASRGVLRQEGFSQADTVASFLLSPQRQQAARNGVVWVDEAGLLPIRDLSRLVDVAREQDARLVLQGDPKQHRAVARHGDMMNVLQEHAGLPVGRLTEIWRQKHQGYRAAVADIARGNGLDGFDKLAALGWIRQADSNAPLVDDYLAGLAAGKRMLVVAPTHQEGEEITREIRQRLKAEGRLGEDRVLDRLVPLHWTEAERGDRERYTGEEVLCFHRASGTFKAGDRVAMKEWKKGWRWKSAAHFSVHRQDKLALAAGDLVRLTANGATADGHRLNNGATCRVGGFDRKGGIVLDNGWTVPRGFAHLDHGWVSTSHASQGRTVDRVLIAMGRESLPAVSAEQFYVSVSRGRESARVYSDLPADQLREAIRRSDPRRSATGLMGPEPRPGRDRPERLRGFLKRIRERFQALQGRSHGDSREQSDERGREHGHGR